MKLRTAIALLRPAQASFFAFSIGFLATAMGQMVFLRAQPRSAQFFGCLLLLAPYYGGGMLNQFFHGVLHRPLALTLPRLSRLFWTLHLPMLTVAALVLGTVHAALNPILPWAPAVGMALFMLTLSLPMEPGQRWRGSRWATLSITSVLLLTLVFAQHVVPVVANHVVATYLLTFGGAFACVALATDRGRLRERVFLPIVLGFDALDSGQLQQLATDRARQRSAPRWALQPRFTFGRAAVAGDFGRLVQAAMVVLFGSAATLRRLALVMPVIMLGLLLFFPMITLLVSGHAGPDASYLSRLHDIIWTGANETGPVLALMLGVAPLGSVVAVGARFAPLNALPLSRRTKWQLLRAVYLRSLGWTWLSTLIFAVLVSAATFRFVDSTAGSSVAMTWPLLVRSTLAMPALAFFATWTLVVGRSSAPGRAEAKLVLRMILVSGLGMVMLAIVTLNPYPVWSAGLIALLSWLFGTLLNRALRQRYTASDLVLRSASV